MKLLNDLFPDKILRIKKITNMIIFWLLRNEKIAVKLGKLPYKDSTFKRVLHGFLTVGIIIFELLKKYMMVFLVCFIPWKILCLLCPLLNFQKELMFCYIFFFMSTVCGTITNSKIFTLSTDEYFLLKTAGIRANRYYFGKTIFRMATDILFGYLALLTFGVGSMHAILLSLITAFSRPVGEVAGLVIYSFFKAVYREKTLYDGVIMALAIIVSYVVPFYAKKMPGLWYFVTSPVLLAVMAVLGLMSLYIIWNYKRYNQIVRDMIFAKRVD